jgi:crossover junction endodeoxyribonuclease RusA
MKRTLRFKMFGTPEPQGSMRAMMPKNGKFPIIFSDNPKLKKWRDAVGGTAKLAMHQDEFFPIGKGYPVHVAIIFYFRAIGRESTGWITKKPDLDKLVRASLDALTGIVYADDNQVCSIVVQKVYGIPERAEFVVTELQN